MEDNCESNVSKTQGNLVPDEVRDGASPSLYRNCGRTVTTPTGGCLISSDIRLSPSSTFIESQASSSTAVDKPILSSSPSESPPSRGSPEVLYCKIKGKTTQFATASEIQRSKVATHSPPPKPYLASALPSDFDLSKISDEDFFREPELMARTSRFLLDGLPEPYIPLSFEQQRLLYADLRTNMKQFKIDLKKWQDFANLTNEYAVHLDFGLPHSVTNRPVKDMLAKLANNCILPDQVVNTKPEFIHISFMLLNWIVDQRRMDEVFLLDELSKKKTLIQQEIRLKIVDSHVKHQYNNWRLQLRTEAKIRCDVRNYHIGLRNKFDKWSKSKNPCKDAQFKIRTPLDQTIQRLPFTILPEGKWPASIIKFNEEFEELLAAQANAAELANMEEELPLAQSPPQNPVVSDQSSPLIPPELMDTTSADLEHQANTLRYWPSVRSSSNLEFELEEQSALDVSAIAKPEVDHQWELGDFPISDLNMSSIFKELKSTTGDSEESDTTQRILEQVVQSQLEDSVARNNSDATVSRTNPKVNPILGESCKDISGAGQGKHIFESSLASKAKLSTMLKQADQSNPFQSTLKRSSRTAANTKPTHRMADDEYQDTIGRIHEYIMKVDKIRVERELEKQKEVEFNSRAAKRSADLNQSSPLTDEQVEMSPQQSTSEPAPNNDTNMDLDMSSSSPALSQSKRARARRRKRIELRSTVSSSNSDEPSNKKQRSSDTAGSS